MREYPGPIFRADAKNLDSTYTFLRHHPRASHDRQLVERLWSSYWPYADAEFYNDIPHDFVARFWEMDLACELLGLKFVLEERLRHGPDICVAQPRRVWVEAVAPTDGSGANASPDLIYDLMARPFLGENGVILRFRQAIEEKSKKYQGYRDGGVIQPSDPYIVAINGCRVSASIVDDEPPWIVQSVYPFGSASFKIDVQAETFTVGYQYRPAVQTATKSEVATDIFLSPEYAGISGIVFSRADARNRRRDYVFVHNLKAANPLERGWLPVGIEYWPDADMVLHVDRHSEVPST